MKSCPLIGVIGVDGKPIKPERTGAGWFFRTSAGLEGQIKGFRDGIICRTSPSGDSEVVQLGFGLTTSSLCNALYSPSEDTALVFHADGLSIQPLLDRARFRGFKVSSTGPLTLTVLADYMRLHRGLRWFKPLDKKRFPNPPSGWCSWYYYYLDITEQETVKNTDWLAENLKQFGCEYVQIDDGWQGRGRGCGTNRDWFVTAEQDFPKGMKWIASYIRRKGFRPGIWLIPFTQSNTDMYEQNPSLFVRNEDGSSPGEREPLAGVDNLEEQNKRVEWAGRYFIDASGSEGLNYLKRLFKMICLDWGYEYVKIDAQGMMSEFYDKHRRRLADPSLSGDRIYRGGLEAIKSVMGPTRFLLNCGHNFDSEGLCEGIRIGGDVYLSWEGIQPAIDSTMRWLFVNSIAFYTDPDVVCVREPLPYNQAALWAALLGITGQLLMASDKMYELTEERVELLRRIFPAADIHPMELYPLDAAHKPGIFDLKVNKPGVGCWDVVALFNWSESEPKTFEVSPQRLGLPTGQYICMEFPSGRLLHHGSDMLKLEVPPTSCRLMSWWADENRPIFVGTSRHITQGAVDVESLEWNDDRLSLSGKSKVVGGDPYTIRVYVPDSYRVKSKDVKQKGCIAELTIRCRKSASTRWQIDFTRV